MHGRRWCILHPDLSHPLDLRVARVHRSDNGYGRYSDKLSERDWQELANAQRAHYNYLEHLPAVLSSLVRTATHHRLPSK